MYPQKKEEKRVDLGYNRTTADAAASVVVSYRVEMTECDNEHSHVQSYLRLILKEN